MAERSFPSRTPHAALLFAEEFDVVPGVTLIEAAPEPEIIEPVFTAAEIEAAHESGRAEGHAAGLADAETKATASAAAALAAIRAALDDAHAVATAIAEEAAENLTRLILETLMGFLPALCARHGEAEARALIATVLPPLRREPAITVRLHPATESAVRDEIARLDPALADRVRLVTAETMVRGDLRVAWQYGEAVRDTRAAWREVAAVLRGAGLLIDRDSTENDRG